MKAEEGRYGDSTCDERQQDTEIEVECVLPGVPVSDGQAGVGPGVVARDAGVVDSRLVVPVVTDDGWRIATGPDVDQESCHHGAVAGGSRALCGTVG